MNIKQYIFRTIGLAGIFTLPACEKVINVDVPDGEALTYVDGWITDKPGIQEIRLLKAVGYFSGQQPEPVDDAQITLTDITAGKTYPFDFSSGTYKYDAGNDKIGVVGHEYRLDITYEGESFQATDILNRTVPIDSITYSFREKESEDEKEGYYAEFYARDAAGKSDYYWIRTYRNGLLNTHVNEMVSIDGSFNENTSDGFVFIEPFREGITSGAKPYAKGDDVKVLIRSLSEPSYDFLDQLMDQLYSGGLFAKIIANVPTNIRNTQPGSSRKLYGWFGTTAESELSVVVE